MSTGLEVADVFRRHGDAYRRSRVSHVSRVVRRVMSAIELCRTAALGGHVEACTSFVLEGAINYAGDRGNHYLPVAADANPHFSADDSSRIGSSS